MPQDSSALSRTAEQIFLSPEMRLRFRVWECLRTHVDGGEEALRQAADSGDQKVFAELVAAQVFLATSTSCPDLQSGGLWVFNGVKKSSVAIRNDWNEKWFPALLWGLLLAEHNDTSPCASSSWLMEPLRESMRGWVGGGWDSIDGKTEAEVARLLRSWVTRHGVDAKTLLEEVRRGSASDIGQIQLHPLGKLVTETIYYASLSQIPLLSRLRILPSP